MGYFNTWFDRLDVRMCPYGTIVLVENPDFGPTAWNQWRMNASSILFDNGRPDQEWPERADGSFGAKSRKFGPHASAYAVGDTTPTEFEEILVSMGTALEDGSRTKLAPDSLGTQKMVECETHNWNDEVSVVVWDSHFRWSPPEVMFRVVNDMDNPLLKNWSDPLPKGTDLHNQHLKVFKCPAACNTGNYYGQMRCLAAGCFGVYGCKP